MCSRQENCAGLLADSEGKVIITEMEAEGYYERN